jgi:hypothetical protein
MTTTDTQTPTSVTLIKAKRPSRASRAADKTQKPATESKPASKPEKKDTGPTAREQREIVLTALVKAGADLAESWSDSRVSKKDAAAILGHRLSYCGNVAWDDRLPRTAIASRSK